MFGCTVVFTDRLARWILIFLVFLMVAQTCICARGRGRMHAHQDCEFPSKWIGTWFQKGFHPPVKIEKDTFSFKGKCLATDSHMFYIEDEKEKCFRCVVIYEKHPNVLQYRETYCDGYKSLRQACSTINADANLYSLFRVDAKPVPCQLHGPFTFSYSRGHGECLYPMSHVDTCTDDSRLLFRFQACADVLGTESSVEELTCLAVWKEGSAQYLVGKMANRKHHNIVYKDDNTYRCFVFDYLPERGGIQMSQSADATCDGLVSPWEGSRTMKLIQTKHPQANCTFPSLLTSSHKWHTLDGTKTYTMNNHKTTLKLSHSHEHAETKFSCIAELSSTANSSTLVTYSMSGCKNGYTCMKIYRRHKHVIEVQFGDLARSAHEACHSAFSEFYNGQEFVTLIAHSASPSGCPQLVETNGLRVQVGKVTSTSFRPEICRDSTARIVGCRSQDTIEFLTSCASFTDVKSFHCHGDWEENGRSYLVTGLRNTKTKYCFVYWTNDKTTHLSGIHDTCRRTVEPGITGNFTFNISSAGLCDSILDGYTADQASGVALSFVNIAVVILLSCLLLR